MKKIFELINQLCNSVLIVASGNIKRGHNKGRMSFSKVVAFTLAETLIVMGVIGIVSALTLPNLNSSTGEKEKIAKVKKIYQNLEDALGRAQSVYGPIDEWFLNDANATAYNQRFAERMTEFMKISKNCGTSGLGCFSSGKEKSLSGEQDSNTGIVALGYPMFLLADGTAVNFNISSKDCNSSRNDIEDVCGGMYVDIDGSKGANTRGKDLFLFGVTKSGIYPEGLGITGNFSVDGFFHSAWIIKHDNMDYLKTTKGKCSNGKVLDWTTNTTCK